MIFYDTETCGFTGPAVILQYAVDDGEIVIWEFWNEKLFDTLELIEWMMDNEVCAFNMVFDHFQLQKLYCMFKTYGKNVRPVEHIKEIAEVEESAILADYCLRPKAACDLMLHSRKTHYQSLMERDDIRIKKVPLVLAEKLANYLENYITFDDIYFARRKDKYAPRWEIRETKDKDPDFRDIVLSFKAGGSLKNLAIHALGIKENELLRFDDVEVPKWARPIELPYAPYHKAVKEIKTWPVYIKQHIDHWQFNRRAREYANNDVKYLRGLYEHFGRPEPGDVDSELACMVASCRWRGFKVDVEKMKELREKVKAKQGNIPQAPNQVKSYITQVMDETEAAIVSNTTKETLKAIAELTIVCPACNGEGGDCEACKIDVQKLEEIECPVCYGDEDDCEHCGGQGYVKTDRIITNEVSTGEIKHPAAVRAEEVIEARRSKKEEELYTKLITAKRFHASFKVIGTLSSRMSGADKLNPQGIKATEEVRSCFPLADEGFVLCGGDFKSFEVVLAEASYNDPDLRRDLMSGKKIHGLFGQFVYPDKTYDEILASEKTENDMYTNSKRAVFAMLYGGEATTLKDRLGVSLEVAENAYHKFAQKYKGVGLARKKIINMFCSMRQPNGIGTKIEWNEPADYIESMFGYRRYFTLENQIVKALFNLAQNTPKEWRQIKMKVMRRDRLQFVAGATSSALYAAAFAIQARNMRAAANHVIQSSGAQITKDLQKRIWDIQPKGVHPWQVMTLNVHDEIMVPVKPEHVSKVTKIVKELIADYVDRIPLLDIDWHESMSTWAEK